MSVMLRRDRFPQKLFQHSVQYLFECSYFSHLDANIYEWLATDTSNAFQIHSELQIKSIPGRKLNYESATKTLITGYIS